MTRSENCAYTKHQIGHWIYSTKPFRGYSCSICHEKYEEEANIRVWRFKYCPQCGTKLVGIKSTVGEQIIKEDD